MKKNKFNYNFPNCKLVCSLYQIENFLNKISSAKSAVCFFKSGKALKDKIKR